MKHGVSGVECPECESTRTRTLSTGRTDDGIRLRRRRCVDCEAPSFLTVEVHVPDVSWGELDTDAHHRDRDYQRRTHGYQGRYRLSRTKQTTARLSIRITVVRREKAAA